ncbi:MAG: hypothetical protein KIS96_08580 [Bauldia sp.]|nr:hypothetical protein [Bauldia sp.]
MWNSLEVVKLIVAFVGPLTIAATAAITAIIVNRRLKRIEEAQWRNRRVIDKRIEIYDAVAPPLNDLYCYLLWVGNWQEKTPPEIVAIKRDADRRIFIGQYILDDETFRAYQALMALAFRTFNDPGTDARIRSTLSSPLGDRRASRFFAWNEAWTAMFDTAPPPSREEVQAAYLALLAAFKRSIGLQDHSKA